MLTKSFYAIATFLKSKKKSSNGIFWQYMPGPSDRDRQIDRPNEQESALDAAEMFHFILLQRKSEKEKRESPKSRFTSEALANNNTDAMKTMKQKPKNKFLFFLTSWLKD
jgi:hypothetical protein